MGAARAVGSSRRRREMEPEEPRSWDRTRETELGGQPGTGAGRGQQEPEPQLHQQPQPMHAGEEGVAEPEPAPEPELSEPEPHGAEPEPEVCVVECKHEGPLGIDFNPWPVFEAATSRGGAPGSEFARLRPGMRLVGIQGVRGEQRYCSVVGLSGEKAMQIMREAGRPVRLSFQSPNKPAGGVAAGVFGWSVKAVTAFGSALAAKAADASTVALTVAGHVQEKASAGAAAAKEFAAMKLTEREVLNRAENVWSERMQLAELLLFLRQEFGDEKISRHAAAIDAWWKYNAAKRASQSLVEGLTEQEEQDLQHGRAQICGGYLHQWCGHVIPADGPDKCPDCIALYDSQMVLIGAKNGINHDSMGKRVFEQPKEPERVNTAGRDLIQSYCKTRFGRVLSNRQTDVVIQCLCDQNPPVLNRNDPRFEEAFEMVDSLPEWTRDSERLGLLDVKSISEGVPPAAVVATNPEPTCGAWAAAKVFLSTLELDEAFLDPRYNRCYCKQCYPENLADTVANEGLTAYVVPRGWVGFGLKLPPRAAKLDIFNRWCASFHGVDNTLILRSILDCGQLMKAGDRLLNGTILRSGKCAGRQDAVFYTSPTIGYAGLKFYARPQPFTDPQDPEDDGLAVSMVLQCRQKPDSFDMQGETMGFEAHSSLAHFGGRVGPWPGHLSTICPHVNLETIEWMSQTNVAAIPYRLLVRVFRKSRDDDFYVSPIDKDGFGSPQVRPDNEVIMAQQPQLKGGGLPSNADQSDRV